MKTSKSISVIAAAVALLAAGAASAQSKGDDSGAYAGVEIGSTSIDFGGSFGTESKLSMGVYGGYKFNKFVAVEGFLTSLGHYKEGDVYGGGTADFRTYGVAAKGIYPVSSNIDLYGRLGITRPSVSFSNQNYYADTTKTKVLFGVGAEYAITKNIGVRLDITNHSTENKEFYGLTNFALGASYKF